MDWIALFLTLKLALVTTILLFIFATPVAWWLAHTTHSSKHIIAALVTLPLVLPPTVLGFYLLVFMGPSGPLGQFMTWLQLDLLPFTFTGLVVGSVIYSFPFFVQPLRNSFEHIGLIPMHAAAVLGASPLRAFFTVVLPLSKPGMLTAGVLGFAHTMGEFGLILMLGGSIPGETKVLSISIFEHVEAFEWPQAHVMSATMLMFTFIAVAPMFYFERKLQKKRA